MIPQQVSLPMPDEEAKFVFRIPQVRRPNGQTSILASRLPSRNTSRAARFAGKRGAAAFKTNREAAIVHRVRGPGAAFSLADCHNKGNLRR